MGDLWVLTARRSVARWARLACRATGPAGTALQIVPIVLLLTDEQAAGLLDERHPKLAFFAAWAMQNRRGPRAEQVVERALELTRKLPKALRRRQKKDILAVLDERLLTTLKEKIMTATRDLESPWYRELRLELEAIGQVEGKRDALLTILKTRGLLRRSAAASREQIRACSDPATLDRWISRASTASSLEEALAPARPRRTTPAGVKPTSSPAVRRASRPARPTPRSAARRAPAPPR
jgi:hypothetical protein